MTELTLTEKIELNRELAITLKNIKEQEMALRLEIEEALTEGRKPGTYNFDIEGMKVKIKKSNNTSVDQETLQTLIDEDSLSDEELDCIRWKGELKAKEYKATANVDALNDCIIVKPAAPTVTIVLGETG